jgi:hypothetical protein
MYWTPKAARATSRFDKSVAQAALALPTVSYWRYHLYSRRRNGSNLLRRGRCAVYLRKVSASGERMATLSLGGDDQISDRTVGGVREHEHFILSTLSPSAAQKWLSAVVVSGILAVYLAITLVPITGIYEVPAFVPAYVTSMFV